MVPPPTGQPGDAELRVPVLALSRNGELGPAPGDAARFRVFRADLAVPFPLSARTASRGMGGRLYQSHGWTREVRVFSAEGSIVQIVRRLDPGAPLTEASWTSELERLAAVTEAGSDPIGEDQAAALRVLYSGIARPDRFPASGDLHVDPSGHIWLQTFVRPGSLSVQNWSVFTPEGRWLGELRVIAGIRVFEIGEDYILGLITDPLGEERLQLFELDKPDRSRP
jgi:hypothetical protein